MSAVILSYIRQIQPSPARDLITTFVVPLPPLFLTHCCLHTSLVTRKREREVHLCKRGSDKEHTERSSIHLS